MWSAWKISLWLIFLPKDQKQDSSRWGPINYDYDDDDNDDDDDDDDEDDDDDDDDAFPKTLFFVGW